jgi:hypothetical protein
MQGSGEPRAALRHVERRSASASHPHSPSPYARGIGHPIRGWNHLPYSGSMRLYNDHYSRTSSSQLCKVNGSTCLHLASSTCRDVTSLDRQRLHGSQPHVPHGVSNLGVVWALNLIVEGRVLSLPSSPDQRKECSLSFSPPPAGQSCLACALWLLVRRPGVLEQEGTQCR